MSISTFTKVLQVMLKTQKAVWGDKGLERHSDWHILNIWVCVRNDNSWILKTGGKRYCKNRWTWKGEDKESKAENEKLINEDCLWYFKCMLLRKKSGAWYWVSRSFSGWNEKKENPKTLKSWKVIICLRNIRRNEWNRWCVFSIGDQEFSKLLTKHWPQKCKKQKPTRIPKKQNYSLQLVISYLNCRKLKTKCWKKGGGVV